MKDLFLLLFFIVLFAFSSLGQNPSSNKVKETQILEQFVGVWVGKGKSLGGETTDEMTFSWLFNKRFLKMNYRTLEGKDTYTSEGFIWFNPKKSLFEYYDFNDGLWEVRQGFGNIDRNRLVIAETRQEDGTYIELIFEFVDKNTLKFVEFFTKNKVRKLLADFTFRRQPLKGN